MRRADPVGGEAGQKMVQWSIFQPNARAPLRGPGKRARSDLRWGKRRPLRTLLRPGTEGRGLHYPEASYVALAG
jgi:hypothetical protein